MPTTAFILCLALMLANAFRTGRLHSSGHDFLLAGRSANASTVAASLVATCLGGSAVLGMVARASTIGWQAFWWLGAGALGLVLLALVYTPYFQRAPDCATLPDYIGLRAGKTAQRLSGLLIVVMWTGVIAAQWVAAASIVANTTGLAYPLCLAAVSIIVALYICIGGQAAVLGTDRAQTLFIFLAIALPAFMICAGTPVQPTAHSTPVPAPTATPTAPWQWLAMTLVIGGMYMVGPDMFSRIRTAKNLNAARRGALGAAGGLAVAALLLTYIGVHAHNIAPADLPAREILPFVINRLLHPVPAAILQAGILAALLSSADTCLMTAASVAERNLGLIKTSGNHRIRLFVLLITAASTAVAGFSPRIIGNIMIAYAAFAGGLLVPLLLLPFLSLNRNSSVHRWIAPAMIIGAATAVLAFLSGFGTHPDFTTRLASAGFLGSLASAIALLPTLKSIMRP
jgi:SSS family solute:Na+ symporter